MTRFFLLASVLSTLLARPAEGQSSKDTLRAQNGRRSGVSVDGRNQTIVATAGQEIDVTLGNIGSEIASPPHISSGAVGFLGDEIVMPPIPSGVTQRFRFRAVAPGRAILTFTRFIAGGSVGRDSVRPDSIVGVVEDTVQVHRRRARRSPRL